MNREFQEKNTGYPHIDKPWMQYYDQELAAVSDPKMNITDYLKLKTRGLDSLIEGYYYRKKTSYEEFWNDVDNASKVLTELGYKRQDIIMNLVPNIPESGKIWLGAAQIGMISDFIDPRPDGMDLVANAKKVLELIKREKAKRIVALDKCYLWMLKPIEDELKDLGIEQIITLSATDSMNAFGKIDYLVDAITYNNLKNKREVGSLLRQAEKENCSQEEINARLGKLARNQLKFYQVIKKKIQEMNEEKKMYQEAVRKSPLEIVRYNDLLRDIKFSQFTSVYEENSINYIGHTSGTTEAMPKPIVLTNENEISATEQLFKAKANFQVGDRILNMLPFFAPFGANNNYILNLASGSININIPEFDISEFGYLVKKYRPNVILATPAFLVSMTKSYYLDKIDLSCITRCIYGGDGMSIEDEECVNRWLKLHHSSCAVEKGYGMSENGGCASYAMGEYNRLESIGIPLPNTTFAIVDPDIEDHLVPIKFKDNEEKISGELAMSSAAVTSGILHGEVIVPHYELDGKSYIRTRDLVEMDRNGVFNHGGRKDRSFVRLEGFKVKPHVIEVEIEKHKMVKNCMIVPYFDEDKRGLMPIAHIVLNPEYQNGDLKEITEKIIHEQIVTNPKMSSRQIPTKIKYREEIPKTANNKGDFRALIEEGIDGSEILVRVEETNLAIQSIEIILPNTKVKKI